VYSVGRAERIPPFADGLLVAEVAGREEATGLLARARQKYDIGFGRWFARVPGIDFPVLGGHAHRVAAEAARVLLADVGAA
jgi:hypothetical protein